jgi:hypothetical protein
MAYQISKTFEKFLWSAGEVILAGMAVVYSENPYYLAIVPILEAFRNYIKHRNS